MSDHESYELLGFDNVLLPVGDLGAAVDFYERAGFPVAYRLDEAGIALLKVGVETPGLLLRLEEEFGRQPPMWPSTRVWLEVTDARTAARELRAAECRRWTSRSPSPPAGPSSSPTRGGTSSGSRTTRSGRSWAAAPDPHPRLNVFKNRSTVSPVSVLNAFKKGWGMDRTVIAYVIYLVVSIGLTVWVARTLSRNGRVFLADVLHGNEKLADAVNHLLVVGFYLVNLGFVALYLSGDETITDTRGIFEALSTKLGVVLLVLGVMHLGNVYVLNKIRRRGMMEREQVPPVPPQGWVAPTAGA